MSYSKYSCLHQFPPHFLRISQVWKIVLCAIIWGGTPIQAAAEDLAFSTDTVQLAWFYKPPVDGDLMPLEQYGDFILTRNDEEVRDELKLRGINSPILQYVRFDAIHDPGNGVCPNNVQPYRNQVAWRIGDYCEIKKRHPDWFLRDINGNEISINEGTQRYVWMDPANKGWRSFWLKRVKRAQKQDGWYGVFLDNVDASLGKYKRHGIKLRDYADDRSLQKAVRGFLRYVSCRYFVPRQRPLQANLIYLTDSATWLSYLQFLDGFMDEAFAAGWRSGDFLSPRSWEADLAIAEQTQVLGKRIKLVSQGEQYDMHRQQFTYASYLLIANGGASFRYTSSNAYNEVWLYDNYATTLGAPLGPRYLSGETWRRDFSGGYVMVNPVTFESEIVK